MERATPDQFFMSYDEGNPWENSSSLRAYSRAHSSILFHVEGQEPCSRGSPEGWNHRSRMGSCGLGMAGSGRGARKFEEIGTGGT